MSVVSPVELDTTVLYCRAHKARHRIERRKRVSLETLGLVFLNLLCLYRFDTILDELDAAVRTNGPMETTH